MADVKLCGRKAYYALNQLQRPGRKPIPPPDERFESTHTRPAKREDPLRVGVWGSPFLAEAYAAARPRGRHARAEWPVVQPNDRREPGPEEVVGQIYELLAGDLAVLPSPSRQGVDDRVDARSEKALQYITPEPGRDVQLGCERHERGDLADGAPLGTALGGKHLRVGRGVVEEHAPRVGV